MSQQRSMPVIPPTLELVKYPDPRLKQRCDAYADGEIDPNGMFGLFLAMTRITREHRGIGLAGPQVGVMKRVLIVDLPGKNYLFANPMIIYARGKDDDTEGCLSYPGRQVNIRRAKSIRVSGWVLRVTGPDQATGFEAQVRASGLHARVLQHEIDHLDGVCQVGKGLP